MGLGEDRRRTRALIPSEDTQWEAEPFVHFGEHYGLGCPVPERCFRYPSDMLMPWASFYHPDTGRGLYYAAHDTQMRSKFLRLAMHPGGANERVGTGWLRDDEAEGAPRGLTMSWVFVPHTPPGDTFRGPAVILQCHDGGWRSAARIYREWFSSNFLVVDSRRHWLRQQTTCLDTMFMLPEGNINYTFAQIPQWARAAREYGIEALLISGWHVGGHDRGYPQYEPDPRLGTWQELEAGIRACHDMGQRVYFFANIAPIDISTEWFREELQKYLVLDADGAYSVCGWGMGTLTARFSSTRPPLAFANPWHPELRVILLDQMCKLVEIGADGIHFDKVMLPDLDFNPRLQCSPDCAAMEGTYEFLEQVVTACRRINPDFCISFEGWWDRLFAFSDVVWWARDVTSIQKAVFPQRTATGYITQPGDYNQVNLCALRGQHLLLGPANFTRGADWLPMRRLCKYVGEITRIRNELCDTVSRGRLLEESNGLYAKSTSDVQLSGPFADSPHAKWSLFESVETGARAVVLANLSDAMLNVDGLMVKGNDGRACCVHQPFEPTLEARFPLSLEIAGERVAFVVID